MTIQAIRGFKDILPDEAVWWRRIEETAARVCGRFGYKNIRIPVLERTELFARGIGEDTDIVEKEMYSFPDRRGQSLTMRPEATAGLVRCIGEHSLAADGRPLKLWFTGPMFRYERPQKGRQRQFHQLDVEIFNDPSPQADAEIIVLLDYYLSEVGLGDVVMNVNSLGCPECRPVYKERLKNFLADHREDLCSDCRRRMDTNPLRVIDCKVPADTEIVKDAPSILDTLCSACGDHFEKVQGHLAAAGVEFAVNPKLVRGLDYYSRTTFEALTGALGAQNAVAGGGRYDGLSESVGGPHIPATGWALGMERLVMLLSSQAEAGPDEPDLFVAALNDPAVDRAFGLVQDLRRNGLAVDMDYAPSSLKSKMRRADKLRARRVLIIGPDELERGEAILRDMTTKEQIGMSLAEASERLKKIIEE